MFSSYATVYTMAPVFSLVLDQDVSEEIALLYPELYKDLTKASLIPPSLFTWIADCYYRVVHCHTAPSLHGY